LVKSCDLQVQTLNSRISAEPYFSNWSTIRHVADFLESALNFANNGHPRVSHRRLFSQNQPLGESALERLLVTPYEPFGMIKNTSKIVVIVLFLVVWFNGAFTTYAQDKADGCNVHWSLAALQQRDFEQDADAAIRRGNPVLLGVYGYVLEVPGVRADAHCLLGRSLLWVIPDTGDVLRCVKHAQAVRAGVDYA